MLNRHDLVFLTPRGMDAAMRGARYLAPGAPPACGDPLLRQMGDRIPGIVRRQEGVGAGWIGLGFVLPRRVDGVPCRIESAAPLKEARRILTPFDVLAMAAGSAADPLLPRLHALARESGLSAGLLGSRALQAVTGLGYAGPASDYDLLLRGGESALRTFAAQSAALLGPHGVKADLEARIDLDGEPYDIRVAELLSPSRWLMAKGRCEVRLLPRAALPDACPPAG